MGTRVYLDKRRKMDDGTYPLKIQIAFNYKQTLYSTGLAVKEEQWDSKGQVVIKHPRKDFINMRLRGFVNAVEDIKYAFINDGRNDELTPIAVKDTLERKYSATTDLDVIDRANILSIFAEIQSTKSAKTKMTYQCCLNHIKAFDDNYARLSVRDIDKPWILKFQAFLRKNVSENSANLYLNKLKAVLNYAIDCELITKYPFRGIQLKNQETKKRSISADRLHNIFETKVSAKDEYALDMFKLMFYLIGINSIDLFYADTITNGRLEYYRRKTGRLYSIKLEPEALAIINKYKGCNKVIDASERYSTEHSFDVAINTKLQSLFDKAMTSYYARHSWATIAADLDISDEVIAMALGHRQVHTTTNIYIKRNLHKVDEANRKVIDYVLGKKNLPIFTDEEGK